jgi:hypothetical protein
MSKELAKKALECVEIKVDLVKLGELVIDDVIEKALDKVVADTATPFDDGAKALVWPILEREAKKLLADKVKDLEEIIAKKLEELKV